MQQTNPPMAHHVPTVYDLLQHQPDPVGTLASTKLATLFAQSVHHTRGPAPANPSQPAARSLAALLDDTFYTYTGVPSWSAFQHLQHEGAALRRQLGDGATFEHEAVHPNLSTFLKEWAQSLRTQQAARARAIGAASGPEAGSCSSSGSGAPKTQQSVSKLRQSLALPNAAAFTPAATALSAASAASREAADDMDDASPVVERALALKSANADQPAEEDGILPLWRDLDPTQRCSPSALLALRAAVRGYHAVLLRLVDVTKALSGHWGLLSPRELKDLRRAMAAEKAAHVPADFLFTAFTELNGSGERLNDDVADLRRCTQLEVLRLNSNPALTELRVLPPHCRYVAACGCSLVRFLEVPVPPSQPLPQHVYAFVTTVGLAYNRLRDLRFVHLLPSLRVLDISFNHVAELEGAVREVAGHGSLTEVTLLGNPVALLDVYRGVMVRGCVHLDQLDGFAISGEERALSRPRFDPVAPSAVRLSGARSPDDAADGGLPAIRPGRKSSVTVTAPPHGLQRRHSSSRVRGAHGSRLSVAAPGDAADATAPQRVAEEALRTSVAADVELLVLKGLNSFVPVPHPSVLENLLPSSPLVLELAGADRQTPRSAPGSRSAAGSNAGLSSALTGAQAGSQVGSPRRSPGLPGSSRKGRHNAGAAGEGGSPAGGNAANSKRVVAPLYEVSSRLVVEGTWGGAAFRGASGTLSRPSSASLPQHEWGEGDGAAVRVTLGIRLDVPPPVVGHHPGRHGAAAGANVTAAAAAPPRVGSAAAGKQRKGGGGSAAAGNGAVAPPPLPDPYCPTRAALEPGAAAAAASTGAPTGSAILPLTEALVEALQEPLVLRVTVEDTFRFLDSESALRTQLDAAAPAAAIAGRGGLSSRNGGGLRGASGDLQPLHLSLAVSASGDAAAAAVAAASSSGHGGSDEEAEEEATVSVRRELGRVLLDPSGLFSASANGSPVVCTIVPCSATPLPHSRVCFAHDAPLEKDAHELKGAERALQQRQRRLRDALTAYTQLLHQYTEAARRGAESPEPLLSAPAAGAAAPATSSPAPTASGKEGGPGGNSTPRGNRRRASVVVTPTASPSSPAIGSPTPPGRNLARSRRASTVVPTATAVQLQVVYFRLKVLQLRVVQRAVRALALRTRLGELNTASLSVSARFSVGRGAPPPLVSAADSELDALRRRPGSGGTRKTRPPGGKGARR